MPFFTPPVVYDNPPFLPTTRGRAFMLARYRNSMARGRSVLKTAGVYTTVDVPTSDQANAADIYYAGGHIYEVTDAEAASLTAAGFTIILGFPGLILTEGNDLLTTEDGIPLLSEYI